MSTEVAVVEKSEKSAKPKAVKTKLEQSYEDKPAKVKVEKPAKAPKPEKPAKAEKPAKDEKAKAKGITLKDFQDWLKYQTPAEKQLKLADIVTDGGTQPRAKLDESVITQMGEAMSDGLAAIKKFPPIDVVYDGTRYLLVNGFHRFNAASNQGLKTFHAKVYEGTVDQAILFALQANVDNDTAPVRRSDTDKRRSCFMLQNNPEFDSWTIPEKAKFIGVSDWLYKKVSKGGVNFDRVKMETENKLKSLAKDADPVIFVDPAGLTDAEAKSAKNVESDAASQSDGPVATPATVELTDEEKLARCKTYQTLTGENKKTFESAAKLFWWLHANPHFVSLAKDSKPKIGVNKNEPLNPMQLILHRFLGVKGPSLWNICLKCNGKGVDNGKGCLECHHNGFQITIG